MINWINLNTSLIALAGSVNLVNWFRFSDIGNLVFGVILLVMCCLNYWAYNYKKIPDSSPLMTKVLCGIWLVSIIAGFFRW